MLLFSQITHNVYRFGATLNQIMSRGSKKEKNKLETKQKHFKFFLSSYLLYHKRSYMYQCSKRRFAA